MELRLRPRNSCVNRDNVRLTMELGVGELETPKTERDSSSGMIVAISSVGVVLGARC